MAEMMLGFECPYGLVDNYAGCENVNKPECAKCMEKAKLISDTMNGLFIGKWISVKDRLPDITEMVLVYCPDGCGRVDTAFRTCFSEPIGAWDSYGNINTGNVTHWMPLPEPPKEG